MEYYIDTQLPTKVKEDVFPIQQFMEYKEDTYDVLGSTFLQQMQTEVTSSGEIRVNELECRFDNLAYKTMGSSDYWWYIMEYNEKIDWNINSKEVLKIPDLSDTVFLRNSMVLKQNKKNLI